MMSNQSVVIDHEVYLIEFGKAVALAWVQVSQIGVRSGLAPKAFAESLKIE